MGCDMFNFKRFSVCHQRSSMKVGADAVLLGCWAGVNDGIFLDVGTGCGIIALLLAQRFNDSFISAIDCDDDSVEEAKVNFVSSPWSDRLQAIKEVFPDNLTHSDKKYDLIVSNPPYFDSGIKNPVTKREIARHQNSLSVYSLIERGSGLLKPGGRLSMIYPAGHHKEVLKKSEEMEMECIRCCQIRNNPSRPVKRIMSEFGKVSDYGRLEAENTLLTLFESGEPTDEYKSLCKEFYLKF